MLAKSITWKKVLIAIILITSLVLLVVVSFFYYYTDNVYSLFGKTSWSLEKDGIKGKSVVENSFLGKKLPPDYKNLKYSIQGHCSLDCSVQISVDVSSNYFDELRADLVQITRIENNPLQSNLIIKSIEEDKSDSGDILIKPKSRDAIFTEKNDNYNTFYWYQDGKLNYIKFVM